MDSSQYINDSQNEIVNYDKKHYEKKVLTNNLASYIVYVYNGEKYIDISTFDLFKYLLGHIESEYIYDEVYYKITNKEIEEIASKTDMPKYVPGKIVFLDNKNLLKNNNHLDNTIFQKYFNDEVNFKTENFDYMDLINFSEKNDVEVEDINNFKL